MIKAEDIRGIEIKVGNTWVPAHMEQLEQGDIFRMKEANGETVKDTAGNEEWVAEDRPSINCVPAKK